MHNDTHEFRSSPEPDMDGQRDSVPKRYPHRHRDANTRSFGDGQAFIHPGATFVTLGNAVCKCAARVGHAYTGRRKHGGLPCGARIDWCGNQRRGSSAGWVLPVFAAAQSRLSACRPFFF